MPTSLHTTNLALEFQPLYLRLRTHKVLLPRQPMVATIITTTALGIPTVQSKTVISTLSPALFVVPLHLALPQVPEEPLLTRPSKQRPSHNVKRSVPQLEPSPARAMSSATTNACCLLRQRARSRLTLTASTWPTTSQAVDL